MIESFFVTFYLVMGKAIQVQAAAERSTLKAERQIQHLNNQLTFLQLTRVSSATAERIVQNLMTYGF